MEHGEPKVDKEHEVVNPYDPDAFMQSEAVRAANVYRDVLKLLPTRRPMHFGTSERTAPYPDDVMEAINKLVLVSRDWVGRASPALGGAAEWYPGVLPK